MHSGVQILSISCSFWENLAKSYVGAPPPELAPPPRENPGSATNNYWEKAVNKLHCNDTPQLKPLQLIFRTPCETRMHSSTMRTACSSRRHGGVSTPPPPSHRHPLFPPGAGIPPGSRHPPARSP